MNSIRVNKIDILLPNKIIFEDVFYTYDRTIIIQLLN